MALSDSVTHESGDVTRHALYRYLHLVAAMLVAGAALVAIYGVRTLAEAGNRVTRAHEVIDALDRITLALATAEASERAYALSGLEQHAAELEGARRRAWAAVASAEQLTRDDERQQARFAPLRAALLAHFDESRAHGRSGDAPRAERDRDPAEQAQRQLAVMTAAERDELAMLTPAAARARFAAVIVVGAAGILGMAFLTLLGYLGERERLRMEAETAARRRSEETLRGIVRELEERLRTQMQQARNADAERDANARYPAAARGGRGLGS